MVIKLDVDIALELLNNRPCKCSNYPDTSGQRSSGAKPSVALQIKFRVFLIIAGKQSMKRLSKCFVQGLLAILPVVLTVYILYWLINTAETVLGSAAKLVLPEGLYVPGMGVAAGVLIVFGLGLLLNLWLFRRLFEVGEKWLGKVPFIKYLYNLLKDLARFFDSTKKKEFSKVVMVDLLNNKDVGLIGFVTREDFGDLPEQVGDKDKVAVYLPMSYQIGGFTVILPKSRVTNVDMSIEEAMRFALTAGVSTENKEAAASSLYSRKAIHRPADEQ